MLYPPFTPSVLLETLTKLSVPHRIYNHRAVFTVVEAENISANILGTHTRNLFVRDKKERMFLVTLRHETPIDLKKLAGMLGTSRFSFGSPERLWAFLGVTPGSVTPFAILNDTQKKVVLVLEKEMMQTACVNFHPLINTMTVGLSPDSLLSVLGYYDVKPQIISLRDAAPDKE